jgi:hypothetical protein
VKRPVRCGQNARIPTVEWAGMAGGRDCPGEGYASHHTFHCSQAPKSIHQASTTHPLHLYISTHRYMHTSTHGQFTCRLAVPSLHAGCLLCTCSATCSVWYEPTLCRPDSPTNGARLALLLRRRSEERRSAATRDKGPLQATESSVSPLTSSLPTPAASAAAI